MSIGLNELIEVLCASFKVVARWITLTYSDNKSRVKIQHSLGHYFWLHNGNFVFFSAQNLEIITMIYLPSVMTLCLMTEQKEKQELQYGMLF